MKQSRIDSLMEAATNIAIGTAIYTVVNYFVLSWMLGIPISPGMSLWISAVFTVVSLARSYLIRRAFNGRSVWEAVKPVILRPIAAVIRFHQNPQRRSYPMLAFCFMLAPLYLAASAFTEWCEGL